MKHLCSLTSGCQDSKEGLKIQSPWQSQGLVLTVQLWLPLSFSSWWSLKADTKQPGSSHSLLGLEPLPDPLEIRIGLLSKCSVSFQRGREKMRVSTSTSKKKTVSRSEDQTAEENCWTVKGTGGEEDRWQAATAAFKGKHKEKKQHGTGKEPGGWLWCSWWPEMVRIKVVFSPVSQWSPLKTWRMFKEEAIAGEMCDDWGL